MTRNISQYFAIFQYFAVFHNIAIFPSPCEAKMLGHLGLLYLSFCPFIPDAVTAITSVGDDYGTICLMTGISS